jgi:hypothetical protein
MSQVIEVAVGLVLVYYILGLIVSFISSRILETLETRGRVLEDYLKKIVGESNLSNLLAQPQIQSLAPIRYNDWLGVITGKVKEAKIERVPVSNLVDAVFDLYGLIEKPYTAEELKALLGTLPESEAKTTYLLPTSWECTLARYQMSAISCNLCQPRHITVMPGSPSRLRPRKPPNWAIHRTACRTVGGVGGNDVVWWVRI